MKRRPNETPYQSPRTSQTLPVFLGSFVLRLIQFPGFMRAQTYIRVHGGL